MQPVTEQIRRELRLASSQGSRHYVGKATPTTSQYARWCQCSPQLLRKFAAGSTESLGLEILDDLAVLTGVFPAADDHERQLRFEKADEWLTSESLRAEYPRVRLFIIGMPNLQ